MAAWAHGFTFPFKVLRSSPGWLSARLSIPHAMHSPLMAPILPELRKAAETCELLEQIL